MSWPIPTFIKIEYPKPISVGVWVPTLVAVAASAMIVVLLLWPDGKPTNTYQFWCALFGAPLIACALAFGVRLDSWEDEQTDAEEMEKEQHRLGGLWRDWTRRHLCIVDVAAFPAASDKIAKFGEEKSGLPSVKDRTITFDLAKERTVAFRRTRLLHLVARRFAEALQSRREVVVTLMLNEVSTDQVEAWTQRAERILGRFAPGVTFRVEAQLATGGAMWMTKLVDTIETTTRLVIAAQFWADNEGDHTFSEGAAAFLVDPAATKSGFMFRPMTSSRDTLEHGLSQIVQTQMSPERLRHLWSAGCDFDDSSALRSVLKADPKEPVTEHLLDSVLGKPGPASGWIALAIAMEAMRGAGPQLVAWREPASESLYLCTVSPLPQ